VCIPVCQAQQTLAPLSAHARKIQTKIQAMPVGKRLTVILKDHTEYHGSLSASHDTGFTVQEVDLKQEIAVHYEDVKKLRNGYGGLNTVTERHVDPVRSKIIVIAIVGTVAVILLVALAHDK
jgi:hypothetical protein